ncbi:hypothetical protein [Rhodococcus sp. PSBB049]|uniref:hypothetical protein n=1 Tax=Rhodococcus sp. PSBB049 TaxID=2812863 RepID=UPI00197F1B18|nr:hypothetical protein [Rhodococcus sp. PSBB049]QSE72306.1 hypothetical protein JYA91_28540 [Rhodococcus sp. PSBB049]
MSSISSEGRRHNDIELIAGPRLDTMSPSALLVAADALRALGAESDSEIIEMWVAHIGHRHSISLGECCSPSGLLSADRLHDDLSMIIT